jgi:putative Mg2+ transporter-C (MgtC) family protein
MIGAGMYVTGLLSAVLAFVILDAHHLFPRLFGTKRQDIDQDEVDEHEIQ